MSNKCCVKIVSERKPDKLNIEIDINFFKLRSDSSLDYFVYY